MHTAELKHFLHSEQSLIQLDVKFSNYESLLPGKPTLTSGGHVYHLEYFIWVSGVTCFL